MKRLIPLAFLLILSGCASFANPFTASRVDTINASWGAALSLAANYRDACAKRLIAPSCRPIVVKLQQGAIPVQAAVNAMNNASVGGTTNAASLALTASDAINNFKVLQMTYGVN